MNPFKLSSANWRIQPVHKGKEDKVIGGAINCEGALKVKIEKTGEETYLSQVINMVREVQKSRYKTQDLADRAAAFLFYVVIIVGTVTYVAWFLLGHPDVVLTRSVTVLVIIFPHALVLAIPLVVVLSTSITADRNIV